MPRLDPLPPGNDPELQEAFDNYRRSLGFVPNSMLIMQRKPKMVKAMAALMAATFDPQGSVPAGFKRLLAHVSSRIHGCRYCMAHTVGGALRLGIAPEKLDAVWEYQSSPLFTEGERAALDFAVAAASVPNAVDDETFGRLRRHWSDEQVVEILGVISVFGLLNRWNDSLATPLEDEAAEVGDRFLASHGWSAGKHAT